MWEGSEGSKNGVLFKGLIHSCSLNQVKAPGAFVFQVGCHLHSKKLQRVRNLGSFLVPDDVHANIVFSKTTNVT